MAKRRKARRRKKNAGSFAYLVNPRSKKRKRRKNRKAAPKMAKKRSKKRRSRKKGPGGHTHWKGIGGHTHWKGIRAHQRRVNPRKRRKSRRGRRRRNPAIGGSLMTSAKSLVKQNVAGGAIAGALNAAIFNKLASKLAGQSFMSKVPQAKGVSTIAMGIAAGVLLGKFGGPLKKYAGDVVTGMTAIGTNRIVGSLLGTPEGQLADVADACGELVANNQGMGMLVDNIDGLGVTDTIDDYYVPESDIAYE